MLLARRLPEKISAPHWTLRQDQWDDEFEEEDIVGSDEEYEEEDEYEEPEEAPKVGH